METSARTLAFVAYLLPVIGPLWILLLNRKNLFAVYHAHQSLVLSVAALLMPLAWAVISWAISWLPLVGLVLVASLFALVMATWLLVLIALILGVANALQGKFRRVPVFGRWGENSFLRFSVTEETVASQERQEAVV